MTQRCPIKWIHCIYWDYKTVSNGNTLNNTLRTIFTIVNCHINIYWKEKFQWKFQFKFIPLIASIFIWTPYWSVPCWPGVTFFHSFAVNYGFCTRFYQFHMVQNLILLMYMKIFQTTNWTALSNRQPAE